MTNDRLSRWMPTPVNAIPKKYRWDWLYNWVANIDDIISDNEGTSLE